jgi:fatty-acyl-CoA synthase
MGMFESIGREVGFLRNTFKLLGRIKHIKADSPFVAPDILDKWVKTTPDAPAIFFEDQVVTWRQLDQGAARVARWAQGLGVKKGDAVAILMENKPDYIMSWYGLHKIGAVGALINTNLQAAPLAHSLNISGAKHLILDANLADKYSTALDRMETGMIAWAHGGKVQGTEDLDAELALKSAAPVPKEFQDGLKASDKALYIYTSGTTGMPKAANISHLRLQLMMHAFGASTSATPKDIMYNVLPLYHSAGGICATGAAFTTGGSVVLKRKFSASAFWDDAAKYRPTLFQYIGELCRYLLNAPEHPNERNHAIRLAIGNGLRPEIWPAFQSRFGIPKIVEFYGATEGNVALINGDNKVGAIGRIPNYMRKKMPTYIVKFDIDTEQPVRDPATGFCIECKPGEAGEAIGKIVEGEARTNFEGYSKGSDTQKKLLTDVFEKGDRWFRTGDLLKRDELGYFYFVDRIGDTFRWKGENVATSEVAEALSVYPGVKEANVYGVKIGDLDGRAGMASLVTGEGFDMGSLPAYLEKQLPAYARPVFIRLSPEIEITGTFKHRKVELVKEGFDPATVGEPLYWLNPESKVYEPLDAGTYSKIQSGAVKL